MPLFALICIDKPDSLALRMATREAHFVYAQTHASSLRLGGPFLDEKGEMVGSLILLEADSIEAAGEFHRADPYARAGLFDRVDIFPRKATFGRLA
ncbi:MAG: YciI family protein [Caulobacteraceae bacterium]